MTAGIIRQRLVRLRTVSKSVNSQQLAQVLNECLTVCYGVHHKHIIAVMREGAAVNGAARHILSVLFPNVIDVICFSHTLNNTGRHFQFATLDEFGRLWVSLFSYSLRAKLAWTSLTGSSIRSYCPTRWSSKFEVFNQLATHIPDVQPFLEANTDVSPSHLVSFWESYMTMRIEQPSSLS